MEPRGTKRKPRSRPSRCASSPSGFSMKGTSRQVRDSADDLRPEYTFDYAKAKPNPYAERINDRTVAVVLKLDVAAAFPDSKAGNRQLRSVVASETRRS